MIGLTWKIMKFMIATTLAIALLAAALFVLTAAGSFTLASFTA